jgi:hypothetical protein
MVTVSGLPMVGDYDERSHVTKRIARRRDANKQKITSMINPVLVADAGADVAAAAAAPAVAVVVEAACAETQQ